MGNSHTEDDNPLGGGLRVNDMILCINGKVSLLQNHIIFIMRSLPT